MMKSVLSLTLTALAAVALSACSGDHEPGEAAGAKVLRNLFDRAVVPAKVVSFKKTQGRAAHVGNADVYEYWYESEVQFPDGYDAKCASEKERGPCALLGLINDKTFAKNEILRSEGTLHFSKTDKGAWTAEDGKEY